MPQNSYTRQSSFSNGDVADATLVNAEFDQLVLAFSETVGHTHDGSVGQGFLVPLIADSTNVTSVAIDTTSPTNHKIIFKVDGVNVGEFDEALGFSVTSFDMAIETLNNVNAPLSDGFFRWNTAADTVEFSATIDFADMTGISTIGNTGNLVDAGDVGTPLNDGFWRWNATANTVVYSATIAHTDLTGLDSANFTHNAQNMQTFLDGLETDVGDAQASAAAAAVSAGEAEVSADRAEAAAMALGIPAYVADAGTFVIINTDEIADVVFEGDGTLTLPTTLVKGRRFTARVSFKAVSTKLLTIANPNFSIIGDVKTLVAGEDLLLSPGELVVLEAVSTTELEIL